MLHSVNTFQWAGLVWHNIIYVYAYTDAQTFVWEQVEDIQSFLEDHWLEDLEGTTTWMFDTMTSSFYISIYRYTIASVDII